MKTIGIIGGSTDLSTAEYYKIINARVRKELGGFHTGEIIINSMDCGVITYYTHQEMWQEGAEYMHSNAQSLERAGADFIISVSNTWHRMAEVYMKGIKIPLLHIADPTAEAIKQLNLNTVALLGTKATMSSTYLINYFLAHHSIKVISPEEQQQDYVSDIVFNELAHSKFTDESRKGYLAIIDDMVTNKGVEGVILGCTEIPLLISQVDRPNVPMFNTLELHAEAAAVRALRGD